MEIKNKAGRKKQRRFLTGHDDRIFQALKDTPRIVGYDNTLLWFDLRKRLDKVTLFLSLNVGNLKLRDLGYEDEGSKTNKNVIEQFNVTIQPKDLRKLKNAIEEMFVKLKKSHKKAQAKS